MHPFYFILETIVEAFTKDCHIISEALINSLTESFTLSREVSQDFWRIYWDAFSPHKPMEEVNNQEGDDLFNAVCGDLGLGETQRSSFFLNYDLEVNKYFSTPAYHQVNNISHSDSDLSSLHQEEKHRFQDLFKRGFLHSVFALGHRQKHGVEHDSIKSDSESEVFPTYADVPYGTSYRQQKKLYEKEMDHLKQQQSASILLEDFPSRATSRHSTDGTHINLSSSELDAKLLQAIEEMDELKVELDACCKRLDSKYQAVAILKKQAEVANTELQSSQDKFHEQNKDLEKQIGEGPIALGADLKNRWRMLEYEHPLEGTLSRVCRENNILMSKLEARSEELRRMTAHKCALARERDELLALLDVTERMKYEQGKSLVSEDEYGSFSSSELAVLGACKCRGADPEPCGCAHAAANLRKEVAKLREEVELISNRRQEAHLTVDAYRTAFEEQLIKTKTLSKKLAEVSTLTSRSVKAKAAMKYLVQVLADDEIDDQHFMRKEKAAEIKPLQELSPMNLHELLHVLTDMVIEKKEILAHQKLASKVLANKLNLYESADRQSNKHPMVKQHSEPAMRPGEGEEGTSQRNGRERTAVGGESSSLETSISVRLETHALPRDNSNQNGTTREVRRTAEEIHSTERLSHCEDHCSSAQVPNGQTLPSINEQSEEDSSTSTSQVLSEEESNTALEESSAPDCADQGHSVVVSPYKTSNEDIMDSASVVSAYKTSSEDIMDSASVVSAYKTSSEDIVDSASVVSAYKTSSEDIVDSASVVSAYKTSSEDIVDSASVVSAFKTSNEDIVDSASVVSAFKTSSEDIMDSAISDSEGTNPFESCNEDEQDFRDSPASAEDGSCQAAGETRKKKSLNPFESDEEDEEICKDGDAGDIGLNHHKSDEASLNKNS